MAAALGDAGLTVAITGRSAHRAAEAAEGINGAFGDEMDVRDEFSVATCAGS
jgi:NADP-dependent 3-hydroxy acid dehydrogenase YdfG